MLLQYRHICVRGNAHQSMFLEPEDIYHAINLLAVFAVLYRVKVLAYNFLSNHYHLIIYSGNPAPFMQAYRISYSHYFNKKYKSIGCVGNKGYVCSIIKSSEQLIEKLIYVLRNSSRHGTALHPYSDPYNSTSYYYYNERGIEDLYQYHPVGKGRYLPFSHKEIPGHFLIDSRGNIHPRCFLNYEDVENILGPYSEAILKISSPTEKELTENSGRKLTSSTIQSTCSDLYISQLIMANIVPLTIQQLTDKEKVQIALKVRLKYPVSIRQLSRILGLPETSLRRKMKQ